MVVCLDPLARFGCHYICKCFTFECPLVNSTMHDRCVRMFCLCLHFFCVVIVVFDLVITNSVFHAFCFLFSCVLNRNLLLVVCNFVCVFVHICWCFRMGYVITLFPHWFGMKICTYSFLWWDILLKI